MKNSVTMHQKVWTALFLLALSLLPFTTQASERLVRVGYYGGDSRFQDGFSDAERKSGYAYEYYQKLAVLAGWTYTYVYGSRSEVMKKLVDGEVDIIAGIYKTPKREMEMLFSRTDMGFAGERRYFVVNKDRPDLLEQLNRTQDAILTTSPAFSLILWQKYFAPHSPLHALTETERDWLMHKKALRIGYIRGNPPIADQDEKGLPTGVVREIFSRMSSYLHIPFVPISYGGLDAVEEALRSGEIDAAFPMYYDLWLMESKGFRQTRSFLNDNVMIIYTGDYRKEITDSIAISDTGMGQRYYVSHYYPEARQISYPTIEKCLDAVINKEINSTIGSAAVLQYFMKSHRRYRNINIAFGNARENFSFTVKSGNSILINILDNAISQISETDIHSYMIQYSNVSHFYSLYDLMQDNFAQILAVLAVLALIFVYAFYAYRKRIILFNEAQKMTRHLLEDALNAANSASVAKTSFLSNMSHDIRTPMNGIIGMTAIAMEHIGDRVRVQDCLNKINVASKHLLSLINEILDMAKIESGSVTLKNEPFNLVSLVDETFNINKQGADAKKHSVTVSIQIVHEDVVGDGVRLQQVFTNLLSNAIKYTPEGGKIAITCREKAPRSQSGQFEFTVKDNGIGMSPDFVPHIFDPFSRVDAPATAGITGTGLGMSISRNIIRMMGGDIAVESQLGQGSSFTATFFVTIEGAQQTPLSPLSGRSVLVGSTGGGACTSVLHILNDMGADPECASSREVLLDKLEAHANTNNPCFAVLLDWAQPSPDRLDLIKELRQRFGSGLHIIVLSGEWSQMEIEARAVGVNGFLEKPLYKSRISSLFEALSSVSDASSYGRLAARTNFSGKRALLAEDNELNAEIAMEILGTAGLAVDWAQNGQEAVDKVQQSDPGYYQCIFMDVQMPVMDGLEAAAAIRNLSRPDAKHIPIFAMTANAFSDDVAAVHAAGMDEHIAKPLDFKVLFDILNKYLS